MSDTKTYTVFLRAIPETPRAYEVDADNESDAEHQAFELLRDAIGWDAAKDWECSDIRGEK